MKRVLVAVSGAMVERFLDRVLARLAWADTELCLLHVVDTRPLKEYGLAAGGLAGRAAGAEHRLRHMGALGAEAGERMLADAEALAAPRLPAGITVRRLQRTGIPEHEIIAAAYEVEAGLVALGAAEGSATPPSRHGPPPPKPGGPPKFPRRHLSPTVRFVVDHAPCDVLLLYADGPAAR